MNKPEHYSIFVISLSALVLTSTVGAIAGDRPGFARADRARRPAGVEPATTRAAPAAKTGKQMPAGPAVSGDSESRFGSDDSVTRAESAERHQGGATGIPTTFRKNRRDADCRRRFRASDRFKPTQAGLEMRCDSTGNN